MVHPVTFGYDDEEDNILLACIGARKVIAADALDENAFGFNNWAPWVPSPPPTSVNRLGSTFIPRAPTRLNIPPGPGGMAPPKQDPRLTRATETVAIVVNGLLRNGDIIRHGPQDFRLSWLIPQQAGADALEGSIFYNTTTGFVSWKDENGVVFAFSGGGSGSGSIDGGGP